MKEKLFQIFFCIFIFWIPILYSILGGTGTQLDGTILRVVLVVLFAISWYFYFSISPKYPEERKMIFILVLFATMYYSTQFFYDNIDDESRDLYLGQLLSWGSGCTSACAIGMTLVKIKDYSLIHKIIPLECIALTPFLLFIILSNANQVAQYTDEGGMNYQLLAYYMAVLFCFSFYYSVIFNSFQSKVVNILSFVLMVVQAVACLMAGGRGGVVLLVVYVLFWSYYLVKIKHISMHKFLLLSILVIYGFQYVADELGMWTSSGFLRSSGLVDDDDRFSLWSEYLPYFKSSPIVGNGLGSDYFTCGFYSHNLIVDFLVESGIIGALIMFWVYWKTYKTIRSLSMSNDFFSIILILFVFALVMNMFSGYWITNSNIWLCFGVTISSLNYYK